MGARKRTLESISEVASTSTKRLKKDPTISIPSSVLSIPTQNKFKFLSWNVNGLNALIKKSSDQLTNLLSNELPDILCIQETKLRKDNEKGFLDLHELYNTHYNSSTAKLGYSGTAVFIRKDFEETHHPTITFGTSGDEKDPEGRTLTVETEKFYLVNTYVPNSGQKLDRLSWRTTTWDPTLLEYLNNLQKKKPVVWCGDLNVARHDYDLAKPKTNTKTAGFTPQERQSFEKVFTAGYIDSFRHLYPDKRDAYSFWSYKRNSRENNVGWRIDYFITSHSLKEKIEEASIFDKVTGSDHCPIQLILNFDKQ